MSLFTGSLEAAASYKSLLSSFKVRLGFLKQVDKEGVAVEQSASVRADASYKLDLEDEARADKAASLSVLGPTSETLGGALLTDLLGPGQILKPVKISGVAPKIALAPLPPGRTVPRRMRIDPMPASHAAAERADEHLS